MPTFRRNADTNTPTSTIIRVVVIISRIDPLHSTPFTTEEIKEVSIANADVLADPEALQVGTCVGL
jgi:hypothetical protein